MTGVVRQTQWRKRIRVRRRKREDVPKEDERNEDLMRNRAAV